MLQAAKLLEEAGWTLKDGERVNSSGDILSIGFLNDGPSFERIINPYRNIYGLNENV